MALKLPRLTMGQRIANPDGTPSPAFQQYIQIFANAIEQTVNGIQAALDAAGVAQAAAVAAQTAADAASVAADNAATAADNASGMTEANAREQALVNSYIEPDSVLTAGPTIITIASHTRRYADGTSVAVTGNSVGATAPSDVDYVYYDDPTRAGGLVTYVSSTTPPVQTGDRHVVGAVTIPAAGTQPGGRGPLRPGYVIP